jgi:amidase
VFARSGHALDSGLPRLSTLLADGAVTSAELTAETLARIDASQSTVNAFRVVRHDAARREAAEADQRLKAGDRTPLLGIPIAIKDDLDMAGEPTAFGCAGDFPPVPADCELVRRLRAAGAIIVGKTNTPELGQWPFTEGGAFGATRNPWALGHTPGGSSGGSAAAVAAGVVPVAVGSDGAGSIRIPAAWTHLVGIKPQHENYSTASEAFYGIAASGPLARTVADAAVLLDVITGEPGTFTTAAGQEPRPLRIGISLKPPLTGYRPRLAPDIRQAVRRIATVLDGLGHHVRPADPPYGLIGLNFLARSTAGLYEWQPHIPDRSLLDPRTLRNIATGKRVGRYMMRFARGTAGWFERRVGRIFEHVDVVLAPTTAVPPPKVGAWAALRQHRLNNAMITACPYAWPWNVLGWPAINIPAGHTADGLPIGVQLLGPDGSDTRLVSLAAQLERVERWGERWPRPVGA